MPQGARSDSRNAEPFKQANSWVSLIISGSCCGELLENTSIQSMRFIQNLKLSLLVLWRKVIVAFVMFQGGGASKGDGFNRIALRWWRASGTHRFLYTERYASRWYCCSRHGMNDEVIERAVLSADADSMLTGKVD